MARQRRGGFRPPELRGTLGTLLRTTLEQAGVVRDALERGAREGRSRLDSALAGRRRKDALAELGELVLDLIRRGEIDLAELPEAQDLVRFLDELDADASSDPDDRIAQPPTRRRFDSRSRDRDRPDRDRADRDYDADHDYDAVRDRLNPRARHAPRDDRDRRDPRDRHDARDRLDPRDHRSIDDDGTVSAFRSGASSRSAATPSRGAPSSIRGDAGRGDAGRGDTGSARATSSARDTGSARATSPEKSGRGSPPKPADSPRVWRPSLVEDDPPSSPRDAQDPQDTPSARHPRDPHRKGGISFDDDDLADYMHPDDVPPKPPTDGDR